MKPRTIIALVGAGILGIVTLLCIGSIVETNNAGNLQVKQAFVSGTLTCKLDPGMYGQWFGDIHTYPEAETFSFADKDRKEDTDQSDNALPTRFNDGAKAIVSGSVRVILPSTCRELTRLHRKFHSQRGVMTKLVLPALRKALFNTGPHMSAAESYAARRGEFADLVSDQLLNGTILVRKVDKTVHDDITGRKKTVTSVEPRSCKKESKRCVNGYYRDPSAFHEFGIRVTNLVIDQIKYSKVVLKQIEHQRKARMDIITQRAQAQQAEARAQRAAAEAKAQIAETRAKEEVQKTQRTVRAEADKVEAVMKAQKRKEVAALDLQAAASEKKANILRGEGEAARRRLNMQADGALTQKLKALVKIHANYAQALGSAKPGALVPQTVIGGAGSGKTSSASDLISLLLAKTAKDVSLDLSTKR